MKLDLHTHCFESLLLPSVDSVRRIVSAAKAKGLDGIAVTEHHKRDYGYQTRDILKRYFNNEILIIPGQEIPTGPVEIVELYLPCNATFRFLAHPGLPGDFEDYVDGVHAIEIDNALHNWHMDKEKIRMVAEKHGLLLLRNSDAHHQNDIGEYYNEITLEELCALASDKGRFH